MTRPIFEMAARPRAHASDGQLYGMEIEAEGLSPGEALDRAWPDNTLRRWTIVEDGSLRHGLEFISLPLASHQLKEAVRNLYNGAFVTGAVHPSVRTGIHIHASCLHLNTDQVLRICQHYALLEPLLFRAVGGQREENIYCIPWYRAHDTPTAVYRVLAESGNAELCKYSALHAAPLFRYGTLEYRHAPTFETADEVCRWVDMVAAVHETASTTYDVLDRWLTLGPSAFASSVFGWSVEWDREFDALEVERVCELLRPSRMVVHDGWGVPPMLSTPGSVMVGPSVLLRPARRNRRFEEAASLDQIINRYSVNMTTTVSLSDDAPPAPDEYEEEEEWPEVMEDEEWHEPEPSDDFEERQP